MSRAPFRLAVVRIGAASIGAVWIGVLGAACSEPAPPPPPPPERIVLVSLDTTRADRIGAYGYDAAHTPNVDGLAERGVRFATAIAPTPMTQPSHATLFTALEPPSHGLRTNGSLGLRDVPTLAEHLAEAGYATAAVLGSLVLEAQFGLDRGFQHYDDRVEPRRGGEGLGRVQRTAEDVADAAIRWLDDAPDRFFLFVHFFDPHEPYAAPSWLARLRTGSAYDAEISHADHHLGRILERVEERWPDGSTLVVVTSDHGESLGEHGVPTHSYTIYEATQHVPLVWAGPGVPVGAVVEGPVRLADVAPTVLALAGAEPLPDVRGRDLRETWSGSERVSDGPAYVETVATRTDFGWSPLFGLRTAEYKYIRAPRPELYDLREDPDELRDLAGERPEVVGRLDAQLDRYLARTRAGDVPTARIDEQTRRRLQKLGYLMAGDEGAGEDLGAPGEVGGPDPKDFRDTVRALHESDVLAREGRPMAALRALRDAPPSPLVSSQRAQLALMAGRGKLAERHAREAIDAGAESFHAWARLGSALSGQGRLEEAERAYRKAHELNPGAPEPLLGLGIVAERGGDREAAASWYERALQTKLLSTPARWRLAALYIEQGRDDEARALLAQVDPRLLLDPHATIRLARAEVRAGRPDDALDRVERSLDAFPDSKRLAKVKTALESR